MDYYEQYNVRIVDVVNSQDAQYFLKSVGADAGGVSWMTPKAVHHVLKVENIPSRAANILKQEMLSRGGEAALHREAVHLAVETTDVLLMGTLKQFDALCRKLRLQPFGLARLAQIIKETLDNIQRKPFSSLRCRDLSLPIGERTLIMGILNVTPDSFSDGGRYNSIEDAVEHAREMVAAGADIIDIGGESTRLQANPQAYAAEKPTGSSWGWDPLPVEEEVQRVLPVLEKLREKVNVPISIDTYKSETAEILLKAGAHIINDVWGFHYDPRLAEVAARFDALVILMHNQTGNEYHELMSDILRYLRKSIKIAVEAGVRPEQIVVDPGIGFGKDPQQSLVVLRQLRELKSLGKPILLGTSRKSVVGGTLNLPVGDRLEGTAATVAWGISQGADIIRVHDVKEMSRVAQMIDAIMQAEKE